MALRERERGQRTTLSGRVTTGASAPAAMTTSARAVSPLLLSQATHGQTVAGIGHSTGGHNGIFGDAARHAAAASPSPPRLDAGHGLPILEILPAASRNPARNEKAV